MQVVMTKDSGGHKTRRILAIVFGLGLAVTGAACADGGGTAITPSGVGPSSLHLGPGGQKYFQVTISPVSVTAGASELTVTVTNDANLSSSNQALGSAQIVVPAGLTVTSVGTISGSKTWGSNWISGQTIQVGAIGNAGQQKLAPGQSITFKVGVTSSVCQVHTFSTMPLGSNETLPAAGTDFTTIASWNYVTSYPTYPNQTNGVWRVEVTGCVSDCAAAPAVANAYLDSIGFRGARGDIINAVAQHMTQGARFDGIEPCDVQAYRDAVIAFVIPRLPT